MQESIQEFIQREFLAEADCRVAPDDELILDGVLDSLGIMRLIAHIEMQAEISIPAEDVTLENFHSINAIVSYLQRHESTVQS